MPFVWKTPLKYIYPIICKNVNQMSNMTSPLLWWQTEHLNTRLMSFLTVAEGAETFRFLAINSFQKPASSRM